MKIKAIKAEVIERIKREWQEHNRDYGLTWNEVATLVNQVSQHPTEPTRPSVEEANKIVEENFKGLNDLIEDADFLQFYKSLISDCMVDFATQHHTPTEKDQPKQSAEEWNIDIDIWWQENYKNYNKCFDLTGRIGAFDMLRVINDYIDSQTKNK